MLVEIRVTGSMKILDRYLLRRMIAPFVLGVLVFLAILLGDEARKLGTALTGLRAPLSLILLYLLYAMAQALVWSLPVGSLVGVAMTATYGARFGETTAMRAGGASFLRICLPYLLAGGLASALAFGVSELVGPHAGRMQREVFDQITLSTGVVREAFDQYFRDARGRIFWVGHMDAENNRLEQIMIWVPDADGRVREIHSARRAVLRDATWVLESGSAAYLDERGFPRRTERYQERPVTLTQALQKYYADRRSPMEMSAAELLERAVTLEETGQDAQRLRVHLAFKYSVPLACLVLAMLAAPLADRFAPLGSFAGLVVAILVVFLYNGVRSWGLALGLSGVIPAAWAGWAQNLIFGALGVLLLVRRR